MSIYRAGFFLFTRSVLKSHQPRSLALEFWGGGMTAQLFIGSRCDKGIGALIGVSNEGVSRLRHTFDGLTYSGGCRGGVVKDVGLFLRATSSSDLRRCDAQTVPRSILSLQISI